jgi:hypothetical protein
MGSAVLSFRHFPEWSVLFPLGFVVLTVALSLRDTALMIFAAPLMMIVWYVSYLGALAVGMKTMAELGPTSADLPCLVGGFIGGVGLTLCAGLCYPSLLALRYILLGAVLGAVGALAFLPRLMSYEACLNCGFVAVPAVAFGIWQAIIGTYLYAICLYSRKKECIADLSEIDRRAESQGLG